MVEKNDYKDNQLVMVKQKKKKKKKHDLCCFLKATHFEEQFLLYFKCLGNIMNEVDKLILY